MVNSKLHFVGLAGSLRKDSFSKALLNTAGEVCPEGAEIEAVEIGNLPLYNQDLDNDNDRPQAVKALKAKIKAADGVIFSTPEYNYSIPGVLKNAIDWVSRPYGDNSWEGKPAAIMSASGGVLGGARAQYALRQIFVFLDVHPLNRPEVIVPEAMNKVKDGTVIDPYTREKIRCLIEDLITWTKKLKG